MNIKNTFITAVRALGRNKMRSALTSIGIIIGVSSVIIMVGLGNSARITVRDRVKNYGTNGISLDTRKTTRMNITLKDVENIKKSYYQIKFISPIISIPPEKIQVKYRNKNLRSSLLGINNDYFKIVNQAIHSGRLFTDEEVKATAKVAIIGKTLVSELFLNSDPLGQSIIVNNIPFKVIGVLSEAGEAFSGKDVNNILTIPITTTMARLSGGSLTFRQIYVTSLNESLVDETAVILRNFFRKKYSIPDGKEDKLRVQTSEDKLKMANDISKALSILLAGIASISLFVGGVGIMNIMLVSVTERTREIGIRMAVGAKKRDIMIQFLIESVTLSSVGGIIGITLGLLVYFLIIYFIQWPFIFSIFSIIISVLFAAAVGIFFGYYPSKKASNLKPIEALKYE